VVDLVALRAIGSLFPRGNLCEQAADEIEEVREKLGWFDKRCNWYNSECQFLREQIANTRLEVREALARSDND
jgi:hypothetical protein